MRRLKPAVVSRCRQSTPFPREPATPAHPLRHENRSVSEVACLANGGLPFCAFFVHQRVFRVGGGDPTHRVASGKSALLFVSRQADGVDYVGRALWRRVKPGFRLRMAEHTHRTSRETPRNQTQRRCCSFDVARLWRRRGVTGGEKIGSTPEKA